MNSPLPFSTPSRRTCKTPGSSFNTPSRSRPSTSRSSSAITRTPGTAHLPRGTPGSRYIPNRLDRDVEFARFQVASPSRTTTSKRAGKESTASNLEDKGEHSRQAMMNQLLALKGQKNTDTVLALSTPHNKQEKYEYWQTYLHSNSTSSSRKKQRKLPKSADKVLDAPNLINDFYLNVLDWGSSDLLAVALAGSVYIFDVARGDVQQLCDVEEEAGHGAESRYVSSLHWDQSGKHLAVATNNAEVKLWDVSASKCVRTMKSHQSRVSSLSWHPRASLLSTGSRSGHIHNYDPRSSRYHVHGTRGHKLDVCGLQWSESGRFLASGGNDNIVNIWDYYSQEPWDKPWKSFTKHTAAVKALAWCPWQPSVLASGGGTADKSIQLVNVCTGDSVGHAHTDSQVSGLVWSSSHRELLSCHGNPSNALRLWKWMPNTNNKEGGEADRFGKVCLRQLGEVTGHEGRVLHMCTSPDKQTVVTTAADETLRFWKIFGGNNTSVKSRGSPLSDISTYIR